MTDSQHLLAEYRQSGSDAAFRELVTRYVALVYSTALRLVEGDTHRAEDVTQTVFLDLARKARTLPEGVQLGGWLHRDTCLVAGHNMRGERRRQARERQAVEMNTLQNHSEADFSQVAPLLDDAINELGEADRTAILLRFFEQQDFRSVGQALGSNEDAARMRVKRALEKLEEFLKRRGVTTSAASLGVVLAANAVEQAAPAGLVATISAAAALAGTTMATATGSAIGLTWLLARFMALNKLQLAGICLALGIGSLAWQAKHIVSAKREQQQLRNHLEQVQDGLVSAQREQAQLQRRLATAGRSLEQIKDQLARHKFLVKSLPDGEEANLYRWSDASEYVRLPKSLFREIRLSDPELGGGSGIVKTGRVSRLFLQTIGLGSSQIAEVEQAVADFTRDFNELERSHSSLTKRLPDGRETGEFPALIIQPFNAEATSLREHLRNRLALVMDTERVDAFWSHLDFYLTTEGGSQEKIRILQRLEGHAMPFIEEYTEGNMTHGVAIEDLPEQFKSFAAAWKTNATQ